MPSSSENHSKSSVNVSNDGTGSPKSKSGGLKPPKFLSRPKSRSNTDASHPDKKAGKDNRDRSASVPEKPGGLQVREIVIPEEVLNGTKVSAENPALCEGW
ncbi:hypothetical protein Moror_17712 [Moniliophthora roreri MCA 2997]|uniref:Uncharacterized protein n=2 Tax=Moniliophthora roreri TaxID=221103 RepID=V2XX03_MONRO|nr:hypothetical protein Moror_17712 [Moniliophthora roreri MCA 2997]KAI3618992.1 hypothetical protein WG66_000558 [Moniliophthora roreri]